MSAYACRERSSLRNSAVAFLCSSRRRTGKGAKSCETLTHVPTSRGTGLRLAIEPSAWNVSA
eukprot:501324-Prymnesium_polylepis.1